MIDDSFFTNKIARKVMGLKEYDLIWRKDYYDSYSERHERDTVGRYAEMAVRMQGYRMLRAAAYILSELEATDNYIKNGVQAGASMSQIQREWKKERTQMLQKLASKADITYDMVKELADDMRTSVAKGMREYNA